MCRKISDREDDDDEQEVSRSQRKGVPPQLVRGRPLPRYCGDPAQDLIHAQLSDCDEYLVNQIVSYSPLDFPEEWLKLPLHCHFRNQQGLDYSSRVSYFCSSSCQSMQGILGGRCADCRVVLSSSLCLESGRD